MTLKEPPLLNDPASKVDFIRDNLDLDDKTLADLVSDSAYFVRTVREATIRPDLQPSKTGRRNGRTGPKVRDS